MLENKKKKELKYSATALSLLFDQEHINLASSEGILWETQVSDDWGSIKLFLLCRTCGFFHGTNTEKCLSSLFLFIFLFFFLFTKIPIPSKRLVTQLIRVILK